MSILTEINIQDLYKIDNSLWLEETIKLLKENRFNELDLDNLIEELDILGKSQYQAVKSWLYRIIIHLLLLEYWTLEYDRNYRHWLSEIDAFRFDLNSSLTTNYKNKLAEELQFIYRKAVKYVVNKSGLNIDNFPLECPYNLVQLLDDDWYSK